MTPEPRWIQGRQEGVPGRGEPPAVQGANKSIPHVGTPGQRPGLNTVDFCFRRNDNARQRWVKMGHREGFSIDGFGLPI